MIDRELRLFQIDEIINGYIVSHGLFGELKKEFTERRIDALNILKREVDKEIERETNRLHNAVRNVAASFNVVRDSEKEGGAI